jgi:adenine deaminase
MDGGAVYAVGKEVVADFAAPFCGIASLEPLPNIDRRLRKIENALRENGVVFEKPILTLDTLTSPAIPHLRITHNGYVRLRDRKLLSLEV